MQAIQLDFNTLLMYYGVAQNPDELTDNEWTLRIVHLKEIRRMETESEAL